MTSPWNDASVSWNSHPAVSYLNTQWIQFNGPGQTGYIEWTVPRSVVQTWIDLPESNYGLMLVNVLPDAFFFDLIFTSREHELDKPARLRFKADGAPNQSPEAPSQNVPAIEDLDTSVLLGATDPNDDELTR